MTSDRIKEIQGTTAFPDSLSVMLALKQVWYECEQERTYNQREVLIEFMKWLEPHNVKVYPEDESLFVDEFLNGRM